MQMRSNGGSLVTGLTAAVFNTTGQFGGQFCSETQNDKMLLTTMPVITDSLAEDVNVVMAATADAIITA